MNVSEDTVRKWMKEEKIPLNDKYVKVIFNMVDWHDLLWGENCLKIKDMIISGIKCFNYYQKKNPEKMESTEEKNNK